MTPARWQKVRETLASALEQKSIPERGVFLAQACADDTALRREVESLLNQSPEFFDSRAGAGGFVQAPASSMLREGKRVGAYRLVRELGRGGMGAVWLAERADERFEQQVAIKLLKRGTDTDEVLRRFRYERQILARLEHPGIARLFDGGETDDGLPFFVMEYVANGESLTEFARQRSLTFRSRLELFVKVCAAVQFAHQHLVVHRDLKPGNILVTPDGEPKLLDFGIARFLERGDEDTTTAADRRPLTPAYASPEQIQGAPITTASDIYSLGAILYELLTEQPPPQVGHERLRPADFIRVGDQEPRRPSIVAKNAETRRRLRGDVDNIVLRAMAREPQRRYTNVSGLADDLRRHLTGRPVRARPATLRYRTGKFIIRNALAVTAGALLVAALAAGVTTTVWEARRATHRFNEVRGLTNTILFEIHDSIRDLPGSTSARQLIVSRALEYLDRLARESQGDKALQLELAGAYLRVGDVQGKPYTANLGDSAGAVQSYLKAVDIATPLAASERGSTSNARAILSQAYESLGAVQTRLRRVDEAVGNHRRALAIREELMKSDPAHAEQWERGIVADYLGLGDAVVSANRIRPDSGYQRSALESYRQALPLCERLFAAHPQNASDRFLLAKTCARIAIEVSELAAAEQDPVAFQKALQLHLRALALTEAALRAEPASETIKRNLADELIALGYLRALSGMELNEGLKEIARARDIIESQVNSDPANAEARQDFSSVRYVTGRLLQARRDFSGAAESYRQCLEILEPLVAQHPKNIETAFDLARVRQDLMSLPP